MTAQGQQLCHYYDKDYVPIHLISIVAAQVFASQDPGETRCIEILQLDTALSPVALQKRGAIRVGGWVEQDNEMIRQHVKQHGPTNWPVLAGKLAKAATVQCCARRRCNAQCHWPTLPPLPW
jgi:hypothetical protein